MKISIGCLTTINVNINSIQTCMIPLYNLTENSFPAYNKGTETLCYHLIYFPTVVSEEARGFLMLTLNELLSEIKQRSPAEQLVLLEELAHSLRHELTENKAQTNSQTQNGSQPANSAKTPEELGWPPGYFETVPGSITDPTFKRHPQGEYQIREELD